VSELFLVARIAGRDVAIRSDQVESVVDIGDVVPVPRASAHVRGLAALRSRVVTVIDPAVSLGLGRRSAETRRAVITRVDGHHYAVLVEALDDVEPFEVQPLSRGLALSAGWAEAAVGMVDLGGTPVLAIDVARLLPGAFAAIAA
jgi:purine-binding chemotaxis protein CheW